MSQVLPFKERVVALTLWGDTLLRRICQFIILATTLVLLLGLSGNVLMRYLFQGGGISWMAELPSLLFPWMIAAGIILAGQQGAHIAIDVLRDALPALGRRLLIIAVNSLLLLTYLVLFKVLWEMLEIVSIERSPLLGMPASWSYGAVVFCAAGLALCCLFIALRALFAGEQGAISQHAEEVSL